MPWQKFYIKYKGVFDMHGLVKATTDWFESKGFEHYIYQTKSKSLEFGAEEEFGISGWYNETDYHRIHINVYIHIRDANPVEVVQDGEKKMLTKAALSIDGSGKCEMDYTARFEKTTFMQKLKKFMHTHVVNERYDVIWEDDLHYRVNALAEHLKKYLNYHSQGKNW